MKNLKNHRFIVIFLAILVIGFMAWFINNYINKNLVTPREREFIEEVDLVEPSDRIMKKEVEPSALQHTKKYEIEKMVVEDVVLGFHPDYPWGMYYNYEFHSNMVEVEFEAPFDFEYGSVLANVQQKADTVGASYKIQSEDMEEEHSLLVISDVEIVKSIVDVYGLTGKYEYSFYSYSNVAINKIDYEEISADDAKELGIYYLDYNVEIPKERVLKEGETPLNTDIIREYTVEKMVVEDVILGYHPDFTWGYYYEYPFENVPTEAKFTNPINFEYGSVTAEINEELEYSADYDGEFWAIHSEDMDIEHSLVVVADVKVRKSVVDVYDKDGVYKYSYYSYTNKAVDGVSEYVEVDREKAKELGFEE